MRRKRRKSRHHQTGPITFKKREVPTWVDALEEGPHIKAPFGFVDLNIEKYPLAKSQRLSLMKAFYGAGVSGYDPKKRVWVRFNKDGVQLTSKPTTSKILPKKWMKFSQLIKEAERWGDPDTFKQEKSEDEFPIDGKIAWQGIPIEIENAKGSIRSGEDKKGHKWKIKMKHHYGRIPYSLGKDGDKVDVYVKADSNERTDKVFKIKQLDPSTGDFDENKWMLGFENAQEATEAYLAHYDKPDFFGGIIEISLEEFKDKIRHHTILERGIRQSQK